MINISQSGDNVVATGSGSINTDGLTYIGTGDSVDAVIYASHFGKGKVGFGPATFDADEYGAFTSVAFGSGRRYYASSGSGDGVVFIPTKSHIHVPESYVSGTTFSDSSTWDSTTIALLGLTPGTYVDYWGSGGNADSVTVNVEGPAPGAGFGVAAGPRRNWVSFVWFA